MPSWDGRSEEQRTEFIQAFNRWTRIIGEVVCSANAQSLEVRLFCFEQVFNVNKLSTMSALGGRDTGKRLDLIIQHFLHRCTENE